MKRVLLALSMIFILTSCMDQDTMTLEAGEFPLGSWTVAGWQENGFTLERINKLPENTFGYSFKRNGELINRANSGWCGTPPVITADYQGKWQVDGDVLKVEMRFWGGNIIQEWRIISSNAQTVTVELLKSDYKYD